MEDLGIKGVQMSMLQPPLAKLYIDELDVLQEMYFVEWRYPEFVVPSLSLSLSLAVAKTVSANERTIVGNLWSKQNANKNRSKMRILK